MTSAITGFARRGRLASALLLLTPLAVACHRAGGDSGRAQASGAGDYWCTVGPAGTPGAGRCAAFEASCSSHVLAGGPEATALRCQLTHTVVYQLRWNSQYGPSEAWYVDAATCNQARATFRRPPEECAVSRWDGTGRRAH
ncbi:MAG: hypothetical protein WCJ30_20105 [Deltaproteobacteria bacterium]